MLIYAELSANHAQRRELAFELIEAAAWAGADGVKVQTYTPDTITLRSDAPPFIIRDQQLWQGEKLWDLYQRAYTPWEWQPEMRRHAHKLGLAFMASVFDPSSVEFWQHHGLETYKIASAEIVDIPLLRHVAATGKPIMMSTGMASLEEIDEAVGEIRAVNATLPLTLLRCSSAYPAPLDSMNLRAIVTLRERYQLPVGLSDHSLHDGVALCAVGLGATVFEKHLKLAEGPSTPDDAFSIDPEQFKRWAIAIRECHRTLGTGELSASPEELATLPFRRSLFVVEPVAEGETFSLRNVRSIRPAAGLPPKHLDTILGRTARTSIPAGTPLSWEMINR